MKKLSLAAAILLSTSAYANVDQPIIMQKVIFTDEQLLAIQTEIFQQMQEQKSALEAIRVSQQPLVEKWQQFLQIILPIEMMELSSRSARADQAGLSDFHVQYLDRSPHNPALFDLAKRKWLFLYEHAFGVTEFRDFSLEEARRMVAEITEQMTSDTFLQTVDQAMANLGEGADLIEKRKALLTVLFPLHMSIMEKYGFEGEKGYVQAQRALIDYYFDPEILESHNRGHQILFKRLFKG